MAENIPKHIAIIPDGNRRWAKGNGMIEREVYRLSGSYENLKKLFEAARDLGIRYLSLWAFSTENWKRGEAEKREIFDMLKKGLAKFVNDSDKNKIRFRHLGRKDRLPKEIVEELDVLEKKTKEYKDFTAVLCLDYGGRDEIVRAIGKILNENKNDINEKEFFNYLDSFGIPEPDLIIRTGGERRLSGFMSYQAAYAELYFTDLYFPDFGPEELREAIEEFSKRVRRFGGN